MSNNMRSSIVYKSKLTVMETAIAIKKVKSYFENNLAENLSVALDDFGTGLSSLSYLRRIPISTIKIDKSFVDGVPTYEKDAAVLKAIITLCFSLNLHVVIEGVETEEQYNFIRSMGEKTFIQGYYFSKPIAANDVGSFIGK